MPWWWKCRRCDRWHNPQIVRLHSSHPTQLVLPPGFTSQGTLLVSAVTTSRRLPFRLLPTAGRNQPPATITLTLSVETPTPAHRLLLEYKEFLPVLARFTQTIFFQRSLRMLMFQYGKSDDGKDIGAEVFKRIGPSLSITVPAFVLGLLLDIFFAMLVAFYRGTYVDYWGVIVCVLLMSISGLFYIMGGQVVFGKFLHLVPISGFDYGLYGLKFIALPVIVAVVAGLGGSVRFYRTIFLEEINKDYVRTARAKGIPERAVLFIHTLKNAMIPILTGVVVSLPFLFAGSLLPGVVFCHSWYGLVHARCDSAPGFCRGTSHGIAGLVPVCPGFVADRHQLYPGRSACATGVSRMTLFGIRPVVLWSDALIYLLLCSGGLWLYLALRREYWRVALRQVMSNRLAMLSFGVLCLYGAVGFLDTLHFRVVSQANPGGGNIQSVLDLVCRSLVQRTEKTYSAPFATHLYAKETMLTPDGQQVRAYPRLQYAGTHLSRRQRALARCAPAPGNRAGVGPRHWRGLAPRFCGRVASAAATGYGGSMAYCLAAPRLMDHRLPHGGGSGGGGSGRAQCGLPHPGY